MILLLVFGSEEILAVGSWDEAEGFEGGDHGESDGVSVLVEVEVFLGIVDRPERAFFDPVLGQRVGPVRHFFIA